MADNNDDNRRNHRGQTLIIAGAGLGVLTFNMADVRGYSTLTKLGFGVLACNSALAVYNSRGDAGSVAFVLVADAALVLLFVCLREFEQGDRGGRDARTKAAVWALTTLLTAMFSSYATKMAPLIVGALVFLCLRELERAETGWGGPGHYAELLKMVFGVVACDSALAHHHARGDAGYLAFVFFAYVGFLTLTWLFLRRFDGRARGAGQ